MSKINEKLTGVPSHYHDDIRFLREQISCLDGLTDYTVYELYREYSDIYALTWCKVESDYWSFEAWLEKDGK